MKSVDNIHAILTAVKEVLPARQQTRQCQDRLVSFWLSAIATGIGSVTHAQVDPLQPPSALPVISTVVIGLEILPSSRGISRLVFAQLPRLFSVGEPSGDTSPYAHAFGF